MQHSGKASDLELESQFSCLVIMSLGQIGEFLSLLNHLQNALF